MMRKSALLLLLGTSIAACGDLGDDSERPPLVTITGQLTQTSVATPAPSNVRVAIIWSTSGDLKSTHDISVTPVFPSKFQLQLQDLPPAEAMRSTATDVQPAPTEDLPGQSHTQSNDAHVSYAVGTIVAYEDLNGNGKLDLIRPDVAPVDRVLGVNDGLTIVYVEGEPPADFMSGEQGTATRGYNIFQSTACVPNAPCTQKSGWLPITTLYDLPLTADPHFADAMCEGNSSEETAHPTKINDPVPAPGPNGWPQKGAHGLVCAADGKTYSITQCETTSLGLCKGTDERCSTDRYTMPSATPPPEWPCPN
jgi:hypothetical protein